MPLKFQWDENKAETNLTRHGVSFGEAATVFGDLRALTIPDPAHSEAEQRFVILGISSSGKMLVVVQTELDDRVRDQPVAENEKAMKKTANKPSEASMQPEYDFSAGTRGKYAARYAQGTNVVMLDPDVAKSFPNAEAVNSSLLALAGIIQHREALVGK